MAAPVLRFPITWIAFKHLVTEGPMRPRLKRELPDEPYFFPTARERPIYTFDGGAAMSRAINVNETEASITETCRLLSITISAIEPLLSGGTRVVCSSSVGAHALRRKLKSKLLDGPVKRSPLFLAKRVW